MYANRATSTDVGCQNIACSSRVRLFVHEKSTNSGQMIGLCSYVIVDVLHFSFIELEYTG